MGRGIWREPESEPTATIHAYRPAVYLPVLQHRPLTVVETDAPKRPTRLDHCTVRYPATFHGCDQHAVFIDWL